MVNQLDFYVLLLAFLLYQSLKRRNRLPRPPGPPGLPIIGNLLDMPSSKSYLTFEAWGKKHSSEIVSMNICGTNIIVLNSLRVITELFEKKSSIYSSRPHFPMIGDLMGWNFLFSIMPYDSNWRRRRRLFQRFFPASRASIYQPQQRTYVRRLLSQLLNPKNDNDFVHVLRHFTGGITITLAYGINVKPENDPYVDISQRALAYLNHASAPGKYLVDAVPLLKYVPVWFPGAKFKRDAKVWREVTREFRERPFQATKRDLEKGGGGVSPSYVASCLDNIKVNTEEERAQREEIVKDTAAIFFGGGTDTTISVLLTFLLAMTLYPAAQRKAQEELDRVVGPDRLPDFHDSPHLPYLGALIREVLRWHPATPLGIPHSTSEDDIFEGYYIPKGALVIPNVWAVVRNPMTYEDPTHFNPDRFLTPSGSLRTDIVDPTNVIFGFGRRVCPGSHMALSTLFIVASCILHTMNIAWPESEGQAPAEIEYTDTLFANPEPFPCLIKPRSKNAEQLIKDEALCAY